WVDWTSPLNDYRHWTIRRCRNLLDTMDDAVRGHPTDRVTRQFGLQQGIPRAARDLGGAHNNMLTGPKNLNWIVAHDKCQFSNHLFLAAVNAPGEQPVPPYSQSQTHPQQKVHQGPEISSFNHMDQQQLFISEEDQAIMN
ncbi:hypothetical protein S245_034432, partial [Arachis hypogaea]